MQTGNGAVFAALAAFGLLLAPQPVQAQQPTSEQIAAIKQSCRSDFMANCQGVQPGGKEALECLKRNVARLSGGCKNRRECDQSAARVCPGRESRACGGASGARAASGGAGGRTVAGAPLHHAAAAHRHSGDLPRRRRTLVQQRTAGPRANPRMSGCPGRELVTRMLPRGRPRQQAIVE